MKEIEEDTNKWKDIQCSWVRSIVVVQLLSLVWFFATPWTAARQSSLSFTISQSLGKLIVHWVCDAIQPSNPLLPTSPAFNHSQPQGLFRWVSCLNQVAKVLALRHQSFQRIFRTDFLEEGLVWSPCSPRDSQESPLAPQFKSISSLVLRLLYGPTVTSIHDYWENHRVD